MWKKCLHWLPITAEAWANDIIFGSYSFEWTECQLNETWKKNEERRKKVTAVANNYSTRIDGIIYRNIIKELKIWLCIGRWFLCEHTWTHRQTNIRWFRCSSHIYSVTIIGITRFFLMQYTICSLYERNWVRLNGNDHCLSSHWTISGELKKWVYTRDDIWIDWAEIEVRGEFGAWTIC